MSDPQDKFVPAGDRSQINPAPMSRIIASVRGAEQLREMGDGTNMSLHERLEYALSLLPRDVLEERTGRSIKQLRRYLAGADIPFSVLTMISVASGVPKDWLASGRPTFGPSDWDVWRLSLAPGGLPTSLPLEKAPQRLQFVEITGHHGRDGASHQDFPDVPPELGTETVTERIPRAGSAASLAPAPALFSIVNMELLNGAIQGAIDLFHQRNAEAEGINFARVVCILYDEMKKRADAARAASPPAETAPDDADLTRK